MPEIDVCPAVIHEPYWTLEEAQAAAQARRDRGERVLAIQCRQCGNFRVEKVLS